MSSYTDTTRISMGEWSVARHGGNIRPDLEGKAYGLWLTGVDTELQGADFLSREEALELRDYITKHLGGPND